MDELQGSVRGDEHEVRLKHRLRTEGRRGRPSWLRGIASGRGRRGRENSREEGLPEVRLAPRSSGGRGAAGEPVQGEFTMEAPEDRHGGGGSTWGRKTWTSCSQRSPLISVCQKCGHTAGCWSSGCTFRGLALFPGHFF